MSLAHAPNTTCPRCLELRPSEIHTCSPTDRWRELEAERDRYREALIEVRTYLLHNPKTVAIIDRALAE